MIRAIYRDGVIYPAEPVPPDWADGVAVRVETEESDRMDAQALDRWEADWRALGPPTFAPGERERMQAAMDEADAIAKEQMRREMESGS